MVLAGKQAIVTGGTGGMGEAVVATLLAAGATVLVPHRHAGELDDLRSTSQISADASLHGAVVDLTDDAAVAAAYEAFAQTHGGLDILVNVAGGFGGGKPVHETDWAVWQQQFDINLKTAVLSCHNAIPHMLTRGGGAMVNVSSRAAVQASPKLAAYAASKRAVLQLTETLAAELRAQFITVNTVLPSVIDTPTNRHFNPDADYSTWVKPADIARVILFLVGPDARIISGAHIPVYGQA